MRMKLAITLATATLLTACAGLRGNDEPDPLWASGLIEAPSERVVREMITTALRRVGFNIGTGMDPVQQMAVSGWKTSLHPFKGKGFRLQAEIQYAALDAGRYSLDVRVRKQLNQALSRPLDPGAAKWEWTEDDLSAARVLLQHIRSAFAPALDVGKPPRGPMASRNAGPNS